MRIVAGTFRGRALVAPKGQSTRPTADRTRQALFNVLEHAAWAPTLNGLRVLDVFAGSGALGLEAISRGAAFCLFLDRDAAAAYLCMSRRAFLAAVKDGRLPAPTCTLGPRTRRWDRLVAAFLDTHGPPTYKAALPWVFESTWRRCATRSTGRSRLV